MKTMAHRSLAAGALLCAVLLVGAALPALAETKSEAKVRNVEPEVRSIDVLSDDDPDEPGAQVDPVPDGEREFSFEVEVKDRNHHQDLVAVRCTIFDPEGRSRTASMGELRDGQGNHASFDGTGTIAFHDAAGLWRILCVAQDETLAATNEWSPDGAETFFDVRALAAIEITPATLAFTGDEGVDPGTTTDATSVMIENKGNVVIDIAVSGADLVGDRATIGVERVSHASTASMDGAASLSGDTETVEDFDLAPGEGSTKPYWFTLSIPSGDEQFIPAGTYAGSVTLSLVHDRDGGDEDEEEEEYDQ